MPPRLVVAAVLVGWLAAVGWLAWERWLPWLGPGDPPAFVVELADEVAPEQANWTLLRGGQKVGAAETRMAPRKDGRFDLTIRMREFDVTYGPAEVKVPLFRATRTVSRDGSLVALDLQATLHVRSGGSEEQVDVTAKGQPSGGEFRGTGRFDVVKSAGDEPLRTIPLTTRNVFFPFQPVHKMPPLRPGQTWRVSQVDPLSDVVDRAVRKVAPRILANPFQAAAPLPTYRPPAELLAQVQADTEDVESRRGEARRCWVIAYRADEVVARTWVAVEDGRVLRQEATGLGEPVTLQRD